MRSILFSLLFLAVLSGNWANAQGNRDYDLTEDKVLYLVGYAHLDTEWRWDYPTTINEYLKNTLDDNFKLFEKYPEYVFNFTGSRRYRLMREYYPERYQKLKDYIDRGRWLVSGSSVDEGDVNGASPESVIRQVLYGNKYFRQEFGKESVDYMLPDCFGFQAHLPSVWAHCGIKGFSTQKLKWGSAVGVPFNVGVWEGPDGESIIMANSIQPYVSSLEKRIDTSSGLAQRLERTGEKYNFYGGYTYYGVGDVGGAPKEEDVKHMVNALDNPDSKIKVVPAASDRMYKEITPEIKEDLPHYKGDFLLTEHSSASVTSQAYMKRWNRKNEKLAQAAELSATMSDWAGTGNYPFRKLNNSWELVLGSQMHDIIPGTSIPSAYHYAWNDEVIAMNGFSEVEKNSVGAFSRLLDTRAEGQPVLVYNPVSKERQDVVEATLQGKDYEHVAVYGPSGKRVPSQVVSGKNGNTKVIFLADLPSAGYAIYDLRRADEGMNQGTLKVTDHTLENAYYKVRLNENGDVASVYDKKNEREMLKDPIRLAFLRANPRQWPAWNMSWRERIHKPEGYVKGDPQIRIKENGPVRVSLEITRKSRGSDFNQTISLAAGEAGKRLVFDNKVEWKTQGKTLKAVFPLTTNNFNARYNLGLGTIERPSNHSRKYEVPSREWIDLTDESGDYGISVLEDCKFGSDKPDGNTIRLTLLHTPIANTYQDQATQDLGTHKFTYALYGHKGNWNQGNTEWQGLYVNQPLRAFSVPEHNGSFGKTYSFARLNTDDVAIRALKKSEDGESFIIRLQELSGSKTGNVILDMGPDVASAVEVDGQEREIGDVEVTGGNVHFDMDKYDLRSFSVQLEYPSVDKERPEYEMVDLPFNMDAMSYDEDREDGSVDDEGRTYPANMLPAEITSEDIRFTLGGKENGKNNAVECRGQKIELPEGDYNKVYILASARQSTDAEFSAGGYERTFSVQPWTGFVGQWDKRVFREGSNRHIKKVKAGYIKRDNIAWYASHHHNPDKNVAYEYSYIYKYAMDLPENATSLKLPDNSDILVFAVTTVQHQNDEISAMHPLYDKLKDREGFNWPEKQYYGKNEDPYAKLEKMQKGSPGEVFRSISDDDYANLTSLNGVTMTYYPEGEAYTRASVQGEKILLQDNFNGSGKSLGTFDEVMWYDNGEGRYMMDLKNSIQIDSINTYSPVFSLYGIPVYTVWGTNDPDPDVKGNPLENGWTYLGANREGGTWSRSYNRTTIQMPENSEEFRYIMWVADKNWHGTNYFFEVDVFENK